MKTRNILLSVLAGLSIVSCTQNVADKPMQIESVNALFDSIAKRDIYGRRILRCLEDSVLYEEYNICHVLTDTTGKNNTINYDKEWMRKQTEDHNYLLRNVPDMLDMLCRTAEKSYRYISGDSIDYNITLGNNPQELLYLKSYSEVNRNKVFDFCYMVEKPANITVKSGDVTSVRELLQAFLAEQKKVKKYEVKYKWDKDVAIPDDYTPFLPVSYIGHGSDSLAVSSVTGIHFFIPAKNQHRIDVAVDFYNRLNRMATEQPRRGSILTTSARFKSYMENVESHVDLLRYTVYNYETRHRIYTIMMEQSSEGIHILELYTPDAPRFTIPWLWLKVKQTHNLDIIPEKDFEKLY